MTHSLTNSLNLEAQPLGSFQYSPLFASTKPPILLSSLNLPSPSTRTSLSLSSKIFSTSKSGFSTSTTTSSQDSVHGIDDGYHIVSTTEHEDGSYVFRFGDASEVAKIAESSKPVVSVDDTEESIVDREMSETEKEDDIVESKEGQSISHSNEIFGSVNEVAVEGETSNDYQVGVSGGLLNDTVTDTKLQYDNSSASGLENDVGTSTEGSVEPISYEIVTPASTESKANDELEGETGSDHKSEADLLFVPRSGKISSEEISDEESEDKIPFQPPSSMPELDTEAVNDFASQGSNGISVVEAVHPPADSKDDDAHSETTPVLGGSEDKGIEIALVCESTDNAYLETKPVLDGSEDNAHLELKPVLSESQDTGLEIVMVRESTDNAHSETKLVNDESEDNAHLETKTVPGGSEDKGLEIATVRESTNDSHSETKPALDGSEDNDHSETKPVLGGREDKGLEIAMVHETTDHANSETKPVLGGSEDNDLEIAMVCESTDDAHSETKPVLDGSEDNDLEIMMVHESSTESEHENILDQEQVHDSLEVSVETKENESEKALEGDAQTATADAQSSGEDETPNPSASPVFASTTEVVNEVTSQEDNNENIVVEAIPLTGDNKESNSGLPAPNAVESSQTSEATKESVEVLTTGLYLSSGAALLPHPSKALTGAEDAYFIDRNWLGIAEGIGEWSLEGTNPGKYCHELMKNCEKIVSDNKGNLRLHPVEVLKRATAETDSPGASTALISHFDGQALHVANIGDSGFILLRNGVICARSSPMLHEFHFPLQIHRGEDPSKLVEVYMIDLEENDIIITATDGLFDNLYDQEIASIVSKSLQAGLKPQEIAAKLGARAQEVGGSKNTRSPFADAAQAAGYVGCSGGKLDNVTVIVSLLLNRSSL